MATTLMAFLLSRGALDLRYCHSRRDAQGATETFRFDSAEIRAALNGLVLTHPAVRQWLAEFLEEGETWQN